jgi:probable HAF family extracellular repeat protein
MTCAVFLYLWAEAILGTDSAAPPADGSKANFFRGALASTNFTLAAAWVGRPQWFFHHMNLGETIGYSTRISQNNKVVGGTILYPGAEHTASWSHGTHMALMGDPTLTARIVLPATNLRSTVSGNTINLTWTAPSGENNVIGYYVYRSLGTLGPFNLDTPAFTATTSYSETSDGNSYIYMVRTAKREGAVGNPSTYGTYINLSRGVMTPFTTATLAPLDNTFSHGYGINASGHIAGDSKSLSQTAVQQAIWWIAAGSPIALSTNDSAAYAIGDDYTLVGWAYDPSLSWAQRGFKYNSFANPYYTWLDGPLQWTGYHIEAHFINSSGNIAGLGRNSSGVNRALLWNTSNHAINALDLLTLAQIDNASYDSYAYGINTAGKIVGEAYVSPGVHHAFRTAPLSPIFWQTDDLGTKGGTTSIARAINDSDEITGATDLSNGQSHAFFKAGGTGMNQGFTDLGILSTGNDSIGLAINNAGAVVGRSRTTTQVGSEHAFIWQKGWPETGMQDLNSMIPANTGWELKEAWGINNAGQIVGWGYLNGQVRGFVLTPN